MTDALPEDQSKSGLILKAAREEMSLTLDQVANQLHLRPSVVRAIEEENYDEFTSDVFLKGYFRTYCRLVNLHEVRMMGLLEQQLLTRQRREEQKLNLELKQVQAIKRKKIYVTSCVFFICLFLIAFAYQMANQDFSSSVNQNVPIQTESVIETESINNDEVNQVSLPEEPSQTNVEVGRTTEEVAQAIEEIDQPKSADLDSETVKFEDQEIENDIEPLQEISGINDEEIVHSAYQGIAPTLEATIKASFSGDCWFKVIDATGKSVIADLKKDNEEVSFTGLAPFHVVIGDASKVSLTFEDNLVNLKPYTSSNGRAELTLRLSESENEG